jgi:hypothetical protein
VADLFQRVSARVDVLLGCREGAARSEENIVGLVVSIILIAAGAIMRYAVTTQADGWNVHTTGMILMLVGALGVVLSLIFWASWGGFRRTRTVSDGRTVIREREVDQPV